MPLASDAQERDEPSNEEGWITMFDGKTLDGWKAAEHPENWVVENGAIKATGPRSHLFYEGGDFKDFIFETDIMTTPRSNSGIFIHTKFQESNWPEVGYEIQVNNSHTDPVRTGSVYNVVKNFNPPAKDNEWFKMQITVRRKEVTIKVNDKTLFAFVEPDGATGTRKLSSGTIALQAHDPRSTTFYKNLRIRPIAGRGE
jgi:hypothetical protein